MGRSRLSLAAPATAVAGVVIVLCMQWAAGVWEQGWSSREADGSAHLVSALVVREYVRAGLPGGREPMQFALDFYHHFPKVAIGHWPPMFHTALGLWMVVTPLTAPWILGFQALLSGLVAGLTVILGSRVLGLSKSVLAGVGVVISPLLLSLSYSLTPDILVAVWVTAGLIALTNYWRHPGWASAAVFGLCAAAALLTKPSGVIVLVVPLVCIVMTRRWSLLREPSFWLPFAIVAVLYGPWHLIFSQEMKDGYQTPRQIRSRVWRTPRENLLQIVRILGIAGAFFAACGIWRLKHKTTGMILGCTVASAYLVFAILIPVVASRHYAPLASVMILLAVAGASAMLRMVWGNRARGWEWLLLLTLLIPPHMVVQDWAVRRPVENLLNRNPASRTWLVVGRSSFEGDVIAEAALRKTSGGLTVYRGSKLFFDSKWGPWTSRLITGSPDEADATIERCGVEVVILGKGTPLVVAEAVGRDPARWKLAAVGLNPEVGIVFERIGQARAGLGPPLIQIP